MHYLKEACVENLHEAIKAEQLGANRIELCAELKVEGLTPPIELVRDVLKNITIPLKVMIRPHSGDFIYNTEELNVMKESIFEMQQAGVTNFVTGILSKNNTIDIDNLKVLCNDFPEINVTFHKAIDLCKDFKLAIRHLKTIPQIKSILTSGGQSTAESGISELKNILQYCGNDLKVIVAGKVTDKNVKNLFQTLGAKEFHGRKIVGDLKKNKPVIN